MNVLNEPESNTGSLEFLQKSRLGMDSESLLSDLSHYYTRMLGRRTLRTDTPFLYQALVYALRDRLMERWNKTRNTVEANDSRRVAYLSLEFLMGRLLRNALLNLGIEEETSDKATNIEFEMTVFGLLQHCTVCNF